LKRVAIYEREGGPELLWARKMCYDETVSPANLVHIASSEAARVLTTSTLLSVAGQQLRHFS
jgi:hypothetical protein